MLKKLGLSAIIAGILATGAFANQTEIKVGVNAVDSGIAGTGSEYVIGFGGNNLDTGKGVFWGVGFELAYAPLEVDVTSFGVDFKLGYSPINNLAVYGIGTAQMQGIDGTNAYGFGYGAGIDYQFAKNFSVGAEYKTYTMTPDINGYAGVDYTYDKMGVNLKVLF